LITTSLIPPDVQTEHDHRDDLFSPFERLATGECRFPVGGNDFFPLYRGMEMEDNTLDKGTGSERILH
ncbi:hypothetical protein NPIL_217271, partial [Nephila pilipes]